jgi:hypothetical protein
MADFITRPLRSHAYAATGPEPGQHKHALSFIPKRGPDHAMPISQPHAPTFAADGAPFYNSGYAHPPRGPLITGGALGLHLPPEAGMIDLSDVTTWDRPVYMYGQQ